MQRIGYLGACNLNGYGRQKKSDQDMRNGVHRFEKRGDKAVMRR